MFTEATLSAGELTRYQRQIALPHIGVVGQQRLKQASVLCVGVGGLGSPLCLYLAACGLGTLGIVDQDRVALSNLHRQILYSEKNCGSAKVEVAQKTLTSVNPHCQVNAYNQALDVANARDIISAYDVVVDCSDNFATRLLVNDTCVSLDKPNVYASVQGFAGQCTVFPGSEGPCLRCLYGDELVSCDSPSCAEAGVLGVVPGVLATLQANEVIKLILGLGESLCGRLLCVDLLRLSFKTFNLVLEPSCGHAKRKKASKRRGLAISEEDSMEQYGIDEGEYQSLLQEHPGMRVIDVRTPEEYAQGHLPSVNIPLAELPEACEDLPRDEMIIVYCRKDPRSREACALLLAMGFERVVFLRGGILALSR